MITLRRYTYLLLHCACMCISVTSFSQGVCSSSALAPVYSQDFGQGSNQNSKTTIPATFTTNYVYNNVGTDGHYIVTPRVQNANKADWTLGTDHTGNTNGNMFLVNAGLGASIFFSKQVDNLCPGSVFTFSAWLANVNTPNTQNINCAGTYKFPKVIFNIKNTSGIVLSTYTTANLPLSPNNGPVNWQQNSFQFALPSGTTSLVLEMVDYNGSLQSYCGNDLALDDILFTACTPTATVTLSTATTICSGTSTSINSSLVNSPFSNPAYQWQKSTNSGTTWNNIGTAGTSATSFAIASAIVADGGMYRVIVGPDVASLSSSTCITASNALTLTVNPSPSVSIASNSPVCSGNALNLSSTPSGGTTPYSYSWSGPNSFSSSLQNASIASATTAASGTYSFTVTDSKSCTAAASANITVNQTPTVAAITNISGSTGGCIGTGFTLSDATPGGVWSSSNTAVATVNSSGAVVITGGGSATISYTMTSNGCSAIATQPVTGVGVTLHPDVIECNNGIAHFDASDIYYGVTYSNSNVGNTYEWTITGGPFSFQGSSTSSSQYIGAQLQTGNSYQVVLKFTTNGTSCSDTQMVYKNVTAADTIQGSHDTTICFNSSPINLSGKASPVTNSFTWSTSGTGSFSSPNSLSTTYTPSATDKLSGMIKIYLSGSSTFNATGNCGTATAIDSMILRIYPNNTASNSIQTNCSNTSLNFIPVTSIPGSSFSWSSSISSGSATGNSANGTGNITDSLVNASSTIDAVVTYTITPYAFTPSNVTCTGVPFTYTVTLKPKPALTITNNTAALCTGSTTNIQFSSSLAGSTYSWTSSVISGSASGNTSNAFANSTNPIADLLTNSFNVNSTVRYRITTVSASGCSKTDSTDVVIYSLPSTANAGSDQALCNVTSTVLAGNTPASGTGLWSVLSAPSAVTFGAASSPFSTVNGLIPGTYQFIWRITNGTCAISKDTVVIINYPPTVGGTISGSATVCAGSNSGSLVLSGYTGSILRWESSTDGGVTWPNNINNTTSTYNYSNLTTSTFFRAVVQNGPCSIVNVTPAAITVNSPTGSGTLLSDQTVCAASNSGTLNLSGYTGSILRWESSTDGGATWPVTINNTNNAYSFNNLAVTTLFRAIVQNGSCGSDASNAVTVTVAPASASGTLSSNATVCSVSNSGTLTLSSYTGAVLKWESSADNGNTWSNINNTTGILNYTNLPATTNFRVLVQSNPCVSQYSGTVTITVLQTVTPANAGPDQLLCYTSAATLAANIPASGTGVWTAIAGNPSAVTFTNANSANSTVNELTTGVYYFVWTVSNAACADSKDTVQLTVASQTVAGTLASSATVCVEGNSGTLTLSGYTGNIVRWESSADNGSTWNQIANTSNTLTYSNLPVTTIYRALVQNSVCAALYSGLATITVLPAVTTASAGTDQTLCSVTSATLAANTPASGTGTWTALAGNPSAATFTNANNPGTTVNGLVPGTYQFIWSVSNGLCADSKDTVGVTVNPQTVPGTLAASATVCATANGGSLSLNGFTSVVLNWQSSTDGGSTWNNIVNSTSTLAYANLSVTTSYRVSVQSGVCAPQYSNINTITVLQAVTPASAGTDQTLCSVTSATLAANTPTSGTGTWTVVAGNPSVTSFTNANSATSIVNGLIPGAYQFIWTVSNGLCADSKDTVMVTVNPPTVPGTLAASATVCATANAGSLSLTGYTSTILNWQSSTDGGSTWNNILNTTSTLAYNNLSVTTAYRVSVQSGVCAPQYSNINTITVLQAVTPASAGTDQTLCSVTSATLAANTPTSGTGTWTALAGNPSAATFTNANNPGTTVNGLVPGTYQFIWSVSNGLCADSKDTVGVTVNPQTVPGTLAASATVCATANGGTLSLTGYTSTVLNWQSSTDGSSTWNNIVNTTSTLAYANLSVTTSYRVSVQSGVCAPQYSNINTITVLQAVTPASAGTDQTLCSVTSATLAANTPTSGTGTWTAVAGNSSVTSFTNANNAGTTVNGLVPGTYQFIWTVSNGLCADSKDSVMVTVNPQTVPGMLAASATVCATANGGSLSLTGYTSAILNWQSSTDGGSTWNNIINTTSTLAYNNLSVTTAYRVSVQSGVCAPQYSNINTITVLQAVTPASAGTDQTLCSVTSATLAANTPTSGTGTWTALAGNPSAATFINANNPATTVNGLVPGTYQFIWTVSNGLCADSKDTVGVTVNPQTVPGTLAASATVCATANGGSLSLTGYTSAVLNWQSSTDGGSTWNNITNTTSTLAYANLSVTTSYRVSVQSGVCAPQYSNINTITVLQAVTTASAGTDQTLCSVTSATLAANTPTSGTGTWTVVAGNPSVTSFTNANNAGTTVNGLVPGTYQFIWTVSNGLCADSKDTVGVTVNAQTVPGILASDATVCATSNSGTLSLSGYSSTILRWETSTDNGVSWNTVVNTSNTFLYTNLAASTKYRAYVQNAICPALYSNIALVNVLQAVTIANAGSDEIVVNGVTSIKLNGNIPASGTGTWIQISGPSTLSFSNTSDPKTTIGGLIFNPGAPPTDGIYQLKWVISNGVCASSEDTMQVTVQPPTNPGAIGPDAVVCANNNHGTLVLTGYLGTILQWETSIDYGANWIVIPSTLGTNQATYTYDNLTSTTLFRALVQNGVGVQLYSGIAATVTVMQLVTPAVAGIDQSLCNTSTTTLAGNTPASGTGRWSFVSGPSATTFTNANDPATTVNGLTAGTYQFAWTITNGICADSKDTVSVIVYPPTVAGTLVADATVCATGNTGTLNLSGFVNSVVRWEYSTDNGSNWNNVANTTASLAYNNLSATTTYRAYVQNTVCPALYSNNVIISVLQAVTTANAGTDQSLCNVTAAALAANTPASGAGRWSFVSGPSTPTFTNANDPATTVNGLAAGTYVFEWAVSNGLCADSKDSVSITIYPPTVAGNLVADATVCATGNTGTLNLSGFISSVVRWEYSTDNGSNWNNVANTTASHAYNNLNTTTTYRAYVQNTVCPALYSNNVIISVLQAVTTANAGSDQSLCNVTAASLAANTPASGTGRWSFVSGPSTPTFTNANDPATTVNGLAAGTYQFSWTITNGICADSKDTVSVIVYPPTIAGTLVADATVCATGNTGTLNLSGFISSVVRWEYSTNNGTNWNNVANTTASFAYNNLNTTTTFRAYVQNTVCPALYSNNVIISVLQAVTTANAGTDQSLCNVTAAALAANTPASGTGRWSFVSGPSATTFTNANDPATTVNGLAAGTYLFAWSITNGICADSKDTVSVIVYPPTVAGTLVADATVCATGNTGTLNLSGFISSVLRWEYSTDNGTNWNNVVNTTASFAYNNLTTTTTYRTYVQNAVCPALYSNNVIISVLQAVTTANAGTDQSLCNVTAASLAANTPASGTGRWSFVSGPSATTFTNANDPATTVNGLAAGTYQFAWTITNGICADSKDTVSIIVYPPTVAGTLVADATVCATGNTGTLNLSGFVSSVVRWEYSTDNGTNWNNVANTTASFAYNNLTTTTTYRAYVQNAVCPALYSNNVIINVLQAVTTANSGADQSLCNVTAAALAANTPASGTGRWSFVSGPGAVTFTNANDPATTVNGLTAGTYQFAWTITNGICSASKDTVSVTIYPPTVAGNLVSDATVCATGNTGTLNLSGFVKSVVSWEYSTNNGSNWNNVANTTASLAYNNLAATTTYRTYVQNAVCPALYSNNVIISVLQAVTTANAGADQSLCNVTAASLAANTPASGTGHWSFVSGPSTPTFTNANDPATTVNGLAAGTYQFAWTITNGICADSKDTVSIIVYPPTVAGTLVADATVCATGNSGTLNLSGFVSSVVRWEYSTDNGTNWKNVANTTASLAYNNLAAKTTYRAYVQNAVCPALYSNKVIISVMQAVTTANAGADQSLCNVTAASLAANTPASGTGRWSFVSGPSATTFTNANDPATTVNGLAAGTYLFAWTITNGICADSKDTVRVIVYPPTVAGTLVADATVCATSNAGTLNLSGYTGNIVHFESSADSGNTWLIINSTAASLAFNNINTTTWYRALVQNGPCSNVYSNTVVIHVSPATAAGKLVTTNSTVCATYNTGTLDLNGFTGLIIRWELSADKGKNWSVINNSSTSYTYTNITTASWFRVLVQSGACSANYSDTLIVSVDPATVAGTVSGDATVCSGGNSGRLSLSGNTGGVLHWETSTDKGTTWNIVADTARILSYSNITATTQYRALVKNGVCGVQYSNVITVIAVAPVTLADAGKDQLLCNANSSAVLNANTPVSGAGLWTLVKGPGFAAFTDATSATTTVNGLTTGTYEFAWTISNGICASSGDTVKVVIDKVISSFILSAVYDCGKTTYHFTDSSSSKFGISKWKWSLNAGDTAVQRNYSRDFDKEGKYTISLTAQSNSGCSNTTYADFPVQIYEYPKANINAITEACKNQLLQLSSSVSSKDSIALLLWNLGNGTKAKDSSVRAQYYSEGQYTVKLVVSTINRCFDSVYKQITVHPLPVLTIAAENILCKGDSARLQVTGAADYIWKDQNDNIICSSCNTIQVKPIGNSGYKVIGYSQYGCSDVASTMVRVIQPLTIHARTVDTLCYGDTKRLVVSGAEQYSWRQDAGLSSYNTSTPVAKPLVTTTYQVIGKDAFNCFRDTTEIKLVVGKPTEIRLGKDTVILSGNTIQLHAISSLPDIKKWRWEGADFSCLDCAAPKAKVIMDQCISCTATNIYGCTSSDTICVKTFCPSTEVFIPNAFTPDGDGINDILFVQGKGIKLIKSFRIYSRWGEMVFEKTNFQPGDPGSGWDGKVRGKPATPDVFVYICEAICEKGTPGFFKGNVAILK